jgi:hypothetical protein
MFCARKQNCTSCLADEYVTIPCSLLRDIYYYTKAATPPQRQHYGKLTLPSVPCVCAFVFCDVDDSGVVYVRPNECVIVYVRV